MMEEIKKLFDDWKKAHKTDCEWKNNFPMDPITKESPEESFKSSFTVDGKFDDIVSDIKILFICRESNTNGKPDKTDSFWMKNVVETMQKNKKNGTSNYYGSDLKPNDKRAQTVYYNYLKEICELKEAPLSSCAYMNLNKRGGYGKCCFTRLEEYVKNYESFIQKEIELLNPETVVFLGYREGYGKKVFDLITNINPDVKCYAVYHPSAPGRNRSLDKLKKGITLNDICNE